jgi:CelD/BcsL family acetyltransferase involved in cellulose biosynthesis
LALGTEVCEVLAAERVFATATAGSRPDLSGSAREIATLPIEGADWNRFVQSQAGTLAYHDPAWTLMLAECYGFRPFALGLFERGTILAGLPAVETRTLRRRRKWISLPFTDQCPPLGVTESASSELTAGLDRFRRHAGVERLEVHAHISGPSTVARPAGFIHAVDLTSGSDSLFTALDRSQVQRGIKRSRRDGVAIRRGDHESDLTNIFYDLHLRTRKRHGIPVQPRRFFQLLWRRILEPGQGFLSLAYVGRIPVAGAVFLIGRETLTYKYNASRPEFWRERPNHALIWDAMKWACSSGLSSFDFGLTHFPNAGLRDFKRRWAANEEILHRSIVANAAFRTRSPDGLPERALGALVRHGPFWVCRGIGELLYKHAA